MSFFNDFSSSGSKGDASIDEQFKYSSVDDFEIVWMQIYSVYIFALIQQSLA